jgi:hypothetical protein
VTAKTDFNARFYEGPDMKADLNHSHQAHAQAHRHSGSTPPGAAQVASGTRYTCPMHPEIVRDAPGSCPKCGMTLIPILEAIARAAVLSRATMRNIRQNLAFAFGYNALGIPVAAGVLYPVCGLLLSPIFVGAVMAPSSVSVVTNALRLNRLKL